MNEIHVGRTRPCPGCSTEIRLTRIDDRFEWVEDEQHPDGTLEPTGKHHVDPAEGRVAELVEVLAQDDLFVPAARYRLHVCEG
ncbi:MAG: hypothetical protein AAFZ07_28415 [Actinomycetota bacterium]